MPSTKRILVEIVHSITDTRDRIAALQPDAFFMTVWDFDGTILKGDCTEGLVENNRAIYQVWPNALSMPVFPLSILLEQAAGFAWTMNASWRSRVTKLHINTSPPFFPATPCAHLRQLAEAGFDRGLSDWYFNSSLEMINRLQHTGITSHVISASAGFFVKGPHAAAAYLNPACTA